MNIIADAPGITAGHAGYFVLKMQAVIASVQVGNYILRITVKRL